MGVVRKAGQEELVTPAGNVDLSTLIRQSVEAEIERRRREKLEAEKAAAADEVDRP